ncbi:hypothetical protein ACFFX0_06645 [Citricoccus parietis]|uniref:Uncharacterized protein n=1 Tax=Citricoccus parietis TaxID=592307 RepID=A0ABV5FXA0_9MICC
MPYGAPGGRRGDHDDQHCRPNLPGRAMRPSSSPQPPPGSRRGTRAQCGIGAERLRHR